MIHAVLTTHSPSQHDGPGFLGHQDLAGDLGPACSTQPEDVLFPKCPSREVGRDETKEDFKTHCEFLESKLKQSLPFPWIAVIEENGINVLLLCRGLEKSIQRRVYVSFSGHVEITVHRKPVGETVSDSILLPVQVEGTMALGEQGCAAFLQYILTLVHKVRSYEICVGVDEIEYEPLWTIDKCGEIDKNPFGELRYKETFRPFACYLLVSTAGHLRRRCPVCIQTKIRFRVKILRHTSATANLNTPNVHLDRKQLMSKVNKQQQKLRYSRTKVAKLKAELNRAFLNGALSAEEVMKICMVFTKTD